MKKIVSAALILLVVGSTGLAMAAERCSCKCKNRVEESCSKVIPQQKAKNIIFEVESVETSEDGSYITVFSSKQDLFATITPDACQEYQEIKAGTRLRLWYEIMTMSLPARTNAVKAKILKK